MGIMSSVGDRLSSLRNSGRSIGGPGYSGGDRVEDAETTSGILTMILISSIIVHIIDAITNFNSHGLTLYYYLPLLVIILGPVYGWKRPNFDEAQFVGVVIAAYVLPYLIRFFPDTKWIQIISGLIFLFPVVALYVAMRYSGGRAAKIATWYIMVWLIILTLYLIVAINPNIATESIKGNTLAGVRYIMTGVGNTFEKVELSIQTSFKRAIAAATGQPYEGEEESRVGIYLEDIKPLESKYTPNSNVFVVTKLTTENIKEPITVNMFCYIEGVKQGKAYPATLPEIIDKYQNIIDCDLGQLPEGTYTVKVRADFEFETTSDIQYTFVSKNVRSDQYAALGIDETTIATYTGGPVALGLPSLQQPLKIDVGLGNTQLSSYPFGVSLQNQWSQGKVIKGIFYVLNVPEEIRLVDCSRNFTYSRESSEDGLPRNIYRFTVDTMNSQEAFDAVTCRIQYDDVAGLLGNDIKSVKTFAARARYEYAVEGMTTLIISANN